MVTSTTAVSKGATGGLRLLSRESTLANQGSSAVYAGAGGTPSPIAHFAMPRAEPVPVEKKFRLRGCPTVSIANIGDYRRYAETSISQRVGSFQLTVLVRQLRANVY